jgi:ABC-2 type transport system permease protein
MTRSFRQLLGFFKIGFKNQFRTPSSWVFGFVFPVIFIVTFGFITNNATPTVSVGIVGQENALQEQIVGDLENIESFDIKTNKSEEEFRKELKADRLDGLLKIQGDNELQLITNDSGSNTQILTQTIGNLNKDLTLAENEISETAFQVKTETLETRQTTQIDFVLPGIIGYSLMSSAVFGVAYSFLTLRKTGVLKRFAAAPTNFSSFLLGQSLSRFVFIFLQVLLELLIAIFVFNALVADSLAGYAQIGLLMILALLVFLSFGYIIAGLAKSDDSIAPIANLVVLPQFILAGTFFSIDVMPDWLANIARFTPLYFFNQAFRDISLEGGNLWQVDSLISVGALVLWGIVGYFVASKVFRVR